MFLNIYVKTFQILGWVVGYKKTYLWLPRRKEFVATNNVYIFYNFLRSRNIFFSFF